MNEYEIRNQNGTLLATYHKFRAAKKAAKKIAHLYKDGLFVGSLSRQCFINQSGRVFPIRAEVHADMFGGAVLITDN